MKRTALVSLLALMIASTAQAKAPVQVASKEVVKPATVETKKGAFAGDRLMYTTYFYTAGEAIVHGYEEGTNAKIISLEQGKTVWSGTVGPGQTVNIPTGRGVFGFVTDKKASVLVGTPQSCTAVGYYVRDQNGQQLSNKFFTELPSSVSHADARVIVWAWEDTDFEILDHTTEKSYAKGKIKGGEYYEIPNSALHALNSHVLEISSTKKKISVQVYYDEGFFVPSRDGRLAGKIFKTYVGAITEGSNDLNLVNHNSRPTAATIKDIKTGEKLWSGEVPAGGIHTLRLSKKYVQVESDDEISVSVAPKNFNGYAEHHFAAGFEGMGIETDFINTTSEELWVFSYYDKNNVTVTNLDTKEVIWEGTLAAGSARGLRPGGGNYRVKSSASTSVMGGSSTCGAEYSPAGGMFRIDEELLEAAKVIIEERKARAKAEGRTFTAQDAAAPLSASEKAAVKKRVKTNLNKSMNDDEIEQRMESMSTY